jgi:hypothetical protein
MFAEAMHCALLLGMVGTGVHDHARSSRCSRWLAVDASGIQMDGRCVVCLQAISNMALSTFSDPFWTGAN